VPGQDRCTEGPAYWCSSDEARAECNIEDQICDNYTSEGTVCGAGDVCKSASKPTVLMVFDIDYTWFGIASSKLGVNKPLYAEPFWDDAYAFDGKNTNFGDVWGIAPGLVPSVAGLKELRQLGPKSILSSNHPDFGTSTGTYDTYFGINSDGGSMTEFEFNTTNPDCDGSNRWSRKFKPLRQAVDFHPRAHILDTGFTCYDLFNASSGATKKAYALTPVQNHCAPYGHKDVMMQNILDYYYEQGANKFDYILFADDQSHNLETVKDAPHFGGSYTWGGSGDTFSSDSIAIAYPHGGTDYQVKPRLDGNIPFNCAGCFWKNPGDPDAYSPYQALVSGFGAKSFYKNVDSSSGELSGPWEPQV